MSAISIRHCELEDFQAIQGIYSDVTAYENTLQLPYQSAAQWQSKLTSNQNLISLVAVSNTEIVGQISIEPFQHPRRKHVATFGMGVKSTSRKLGVGSALVIAAIKLCEQWLNILRIEIEVYTDNTSAIALYKKHGFQIEGTCKNYAFRNGSFVDIYIMAKLVERSENVA